VGVTTPFKAKTCGGSRRSHCAPASEKASAWMESTNAFGAISDVRKNCGLSAAFFAFSQDFVH
jgi:hypothetical protein